MIEKNSRYYKLLKLYGYDIVKKACKYFESIGKHCAADEFEKKCEQIFNEGKD